MPRTPSPPAARATGAANPELQLWLKGAPPRACILAKLSSDNLIFVSVIDHAEPDERAHPKDETVMLLAHGLQREAIAIRARVCHQTRERWVLAPLDGQWAELRKLRSRPPGDVGASGGRQLQLSRHQRGLLLDRYADRLTDHLQRSYPALCNALDDALLRAAAANEVDQITCIEALQRFASIRESLRGALIDAARGHVHGAARPDYLPGEPDFGPLEASAPARATAARARLSAAQLARDSTQAHAAILERLAVHFSILVQRLTEPAALPGGPAWLCHHLAAALAAAALPAGATDLIYRAFGEQCLSDMRLLAQDLIGICEGRPALSQPAAAAPADQDAAAERVPAGARELGHLFTALEQLRTALEDPAPLAHRNSASLGLAALAQALDAAADQWQPDGGRSLCEQLRLHLQARGAEQPTWSDDQHRLLSIAEDLLDRIADHGQTAADARPLLRRLKPAVMKLLLEDAGLLTRRAHPALQACNLIARLCRVDYFRGASAGGELTDLCRRLTSEGRDNRRLFGVLLPRLRELNARQQGLRERTLQRLCATLDGQYAIATAKARVADALAQRYGGLPFPPVLQHLLDQGWHQLLERVALDGDKPRGAGPHPLALLHALYCRLQPRPAVCDREPGEAALADLSEDELTAALVAPMDAYGLSSPQFRQSVTPLLEALRQGAAASCPLYAAVNAPAPATPARVGARNRCSALQLPVGAWLARPQADPHEADALLQLAWRSPDDTRCVLVNERGQSVGEWSCGELTAMLRTDLCRMSAPEHWPVLERELFNMVSAAYACATRSSHGHAIAGLTGVDEFRQRLGALADHDSAGSTGHGLIGVDIRPLQQIARRHGEAALRALLTQCAAVIQSLFPATAFATRGPKLELIVALPCDDCEGLQSAARDLQQALASQPFCRDGRTYSVTSRLGITAVRAGAPASTLLDEVVEATARAAAGNGATIVDGTRSRPPAAPSGGASWLTALGRALEEQRLALRCQAIVALDEKRPAQYEILLGIVGDDGVVGAPGELVAAAERQGRMDIIDRWVIEQSIRWLGSAQARDHRAGLISINLSANALGSEPFLDYLLTELDAGTLCRSRLRFEIAEASARANLARTAYFCNSIRSRGCQVALDDFGRSADSLQVLRLLPVDAVKIDGHHISALVHSACQRALVAAIVGTSRFLGIQTIAESVESEQSLPLLQELGVDYAQGYAVARPVPLASA